MLQLLRQIQNRHIWLFLQPIIHVSLQFDLKAAKIFILRSIKFQYLYSRPKKSKPVYTRKNVIENDSFILGAAFVPNLKMKQDSSYGLWQRRSQLFFLDSNQVRIHGECTRDKFI